MMNLKYDISIHPAVFSQLISKHSLVFIIYLLNIFFAPKYMNNRNLNFAMWSYPLNFKIKIRIAIDFYPPCIYK